MTLRTRHNTRFAYILFDLDDTLYPKQAGVMPAIIERIKQFMIQRVGIPADDVAERRMHFLQTYGTTLRGLMEEHQIEPSDFLDYVHDLDLHKYLGPSPPLAYLLEQTPLDKVIFTNSDLGHAERVLDVLGVRQYFDEIFDITVRNLLNKPRPEAYDFVLDKLRVSGDRCIMVEDTPRNLLPAKNLGMTTILVNGGDDLTGIDYVVPTVFHTERVLKELLNPERR